MNIGMSNNEFQFFDIQFFDILIWYRPDLAHHPGISFSLPGRWCRKAVWSHEENLVAVLIFKLSITPTEGDKAEAKVF